MMSSNRGLWLLVIALFVVIVVLLVVLVFMPGRAPTPASVATSTTSAPIPTTTAPAPLSARVSVSSPKENAIVGSVFDVVGQAPGNWFFEAQFPIQVRDAQENVIGRATGSAQGDWMTEKLVAFKATLHVDESYHGPATLILMKDNPSGLPENDDSVEVPIVIN